MYISKAHFDRWNDHFSTFDTKALFPREVDKGFEEFRQWYLEHNATDIKGLTKKIFKKWLVKAGYVIATKKRRK